MEKTESKTETLQQSLEKHIENAMSLQEGINNESLNLTEAVEQLAELLIETIHIIKTINDQKEK